MVCLLKKIKIIIYIQTNRHLLIFIQTPSWLLLLTSLSHCLSHTDTQTDTNSWRLWPLQFKRCSSQWPDVTLLADPKSFFKDAFIHLFSTSWLRLLYSSSSLTLVPTRRHRDTQKYRVIGHNCKHRLGKNNIIWFSPTAYEAGGK